MAGVDETRSEPSITLHSSWLGIGSAALGVALLVVVAIALLVTNGLGVVTGLVALAAVGASAVVLFDMPIATRFESDSVERLTILHRRRIELDRIDRFARMRRAVRRPGTGVPTTGLVAMRGRRQVLLVDRMEGLAEHEALRALLHPEDSERLLSSVVKPPINRTPTWAGRRKKWHPESG